MSNSIPPPKKSRSLFDLVHDDNSVENVSDDDIASFQKSTSLGESTIDPLVWWRSNSIRFLTIALLARDGLDIPETSITSERCFSDSGYVAQDHRSNLSDESIQA